MGYALLILAGLLIVGFCTGSIELPDNFFKNSNNSDDDDDFYRNFYRDSDFWD
ncbi:hypothetical protein [Flavobacterium adhaerens]|uniref:hypothetical protein n=1 Tax=Flavobacterium adhaerens TaxID=3149043 RepID=UPI0032B59A08